MSTVSKKRKFEHTNLSTDNIPAKKQRLNDENDQITEISNKNDTESKNDDECKELIAKNLKQPPLKDNIRSELAKIVQDLYAYKPKYKINPKTGSITFYPSPHLTEKEYGQKIFAKEKFIHSAQLNHFLSKLGCSSIESIYDLNAEIIKKDDSFHGFVRAMEIAYFDHYPLRIRVSHIWLLILHALAAHIDVNSEKLRHKYVQFDDKKDLIVIRPDFVKGSPENDWKSVIDEFEQQIDKNTVHDTAKVIQNDFSVTTDLEKIASKVSLMDACKHYFNYVVRCGCGFREITLDGTKADWINLRKKVEILLTDKVDKQWANKWEKALFCILDRFIDAYNGEIDCLFWNSMVRRTKPGSGNLIPINDEKELSDMNTFYSGWINTFFPYLNEMKSVGGWARRQKQRANPNESEGTYNDPNGNQCSFEENNASYKLYSMQQYFKSKSGYGGWNGQPLKQTLSQNSSVKIFPIGLANAPVVMEDVKSGNKYKFKFAAGFIGVEQSEKTLEICPKIGWFIAEK